MKVITKILESANIHYKILEFNRYKKVSRFKELVDSPYTLELMRVIARDRVTARDGRKALQQELEIMELCELSAASGVAPRTAAESTFRQAIGRLSELDLVEETGKKVEGRYVNSYMLKYNLLLFKGEHGSWIPTVIFTCSRKQAILKKEIFRIGARDEDILSILPSSNFCVECGAECEILKGLKRLDRIRKSPKKGKED